jgi:hypothetical protein
MVQPREEITMRKKKKMNKGVATGIHNAVLNRLQNTQKNLTVLEQLLGCYLHAHGEPIFIELVDVPGDWILVTDEAMTSISGNRVIKLSLVQRAELKKDNGDDEEILDEIVLASERK